jgi:excinuclease ABC subunit C
LTLRLGVGHAWPRLQLVRKPTADGARYFGPYHSATAARRTLHLVEKHFQLRTCSDRELVSRKRPCLQYQIKRCPAPCVESVDAERYAGQVRAVSLFLDGRHDQLRRELEQRMNAAAGQFEYELAGLYRDQLRALDAVREQQRVVAVTGKNQDVLGIYRQGDLAELAVLYVRAGRVVDTGRFSSTRVALGDEEVVAAFLRQHYSEGGPGAGLIPDEVVVPRLPEGAAGVQEWLSDRCAQSAQKRPPGARPARRCRLVAPARGKLKQLLELANENALHAFEEKQRAAGDMDERLAQLQQRLRLPILPRRIECCDISHLGGQDTVGAVVALLNGAPDRARYRSYTVREGRESDDYAALSEVLQRRFRRGRDAAGSGEEGAGEWDLPDLFVVDGGRGQLNVALTAAGDLGLHSLQIVGMAKERETGRGDKLVDRVYLPGQKNPIPLRPNSAELFLLAKVRDEAHRFANRGRKRVGKRRRIASELDSIPGIGPKTRVALLSSLGSVAGVRDASDQEILAVTGVTRRHLAALRSHFVPPQGPEKAPDPKA